MGLYPRNFNEYIASIGIPRHEDSQVYLVDPDDGVTGRDGTTLATSVPTVQEAEALCTGDQHDVVMMISSDSASNLAAALDWDKDFTHLVGLSSNLNGVGQRCRVVGLPAADVVYCVNFSGKGCIVRNIKFCNESDADVDSGGVIVSGGRNEFTNCAFEGMVHATPAARAASYSLTLSGEENEFNNCSVGVDTIVRAAANAELLVTGGARNYFEKCKFLSASETAGKFLVSITNMDRWIEFRDCVFYNFSVNHVNTLTNVFSDTEGATHDIIFSGGPPTVVGCDGLGDTVTSMWGTGAAPAGGYGIAINPTG